MRTKSRRPFTSLSSRRALRWSISSGSGEGGTWFSQGIFNRPKNEREGGAQFVAHIAEKGSLGAVEISQFFGAPSFGLVGLGVGDAGGDLACRADRESLRSWRQTGGTGSAPAMKTPAGFSWPRRDMGTSLAWSGGLFQTPVGRSGKRSPSRSMVMAAIGAEKNVDGPRAAEDSASISRGAAG